MPLFQATMKISVFTEVARAQLPSIALQLTEKCLLHDPALCGYICYTWTLLTWPHYCKWCHSCDPCSHDPTTASDVTHMTPAHMTPLLQVPKTG